MDGLQKHYTRCYKPDIKDVLYNSPSMTFPKGTSTETESWSESCLRIGCKWTLGSLLAWWKCFKIKLWWWLHSYINLSKKSWVVHLKCVDFMVIYNSEKLFEGRKAFTQLQHGMLPGRGWRPREEGGWVRWEPNGFENLVIHRGNEQISTFIEENGDWFSYCSRRELQIRKGES